MKQFLLCGAAALLFGLAACAGPAADGGTSPLPDSSSAQAGPPAASTPATAAPEQTPAPATVGVALAEGTPPDGDVAFLDEAAQEPVYVTFTTDTAVTGFRFLSLALLDIDEGGTMSFDVQPLYEAEALTPEAPLVIGMAFAGLIPDRGIAYTDTNGSTKYFSVEMSGEDGAPILVAFPN